MKLEGLYRQSGMHAAGVVIGDRPLDQLVPLYKDPKADMPVTQYDMKFVEETGLIKFDFLGLKTLTVIKKAVDWVKKVHKIDLDIDNIPLDDKLTYETVSYTHLDVYKRQDDNPMFAAEIMRLQRQNVARRDADSFNAEIVSGIQNLPGTPRAVVLVASFICIGHFFFLFLLSFYLMKTNINNIS